MFRDLATSAAAVLILAAATFFWLNTRKPEGKTEPKEKTGVVAQNDIAPGKTTALLTLADGRKVMLDSTVVGQLAKEGETVVQNENATLVYQGKDHAQKEELFNTLSTTNGQTYKMVLADGSKVWLNTGASIRYPVAFTGSERKVEITGEAYFEVAKNANKPFIVDILPSTGGAGGGRGQRVEVLGTHFNINAYNDDSVIKTTLLEGSVKVRQGNSVTLLKPAQQAQVGNGVTKLIHHANVEAVTAWKNGRFNFDKADIMVVMGQLAKWYNVEVVYEGAKPTKLFVGEMERNQMLSQVVKMLEYTEGVHFRIEGRQLIVMSPEMFEARKSDKKQQK